MRVRRSVYEARLRAPLVSSHDSVQVRSLILLELEADDGVIGHGEAAPLPSYDGVDPDDVLEALERCRPLLEASDGFDHEILLAQCAATGCPPQALAAIDLALWDLAGRRAGEPVWRLLGAAAPTPIEVNATIGALDAGDAAEAASSALADGFGTVKVKVGLGDDLERIRAIRSAVGPALAIRIDANGAWSIDQAIASLNRLEPLGIECCEEPVHGVRSIQQVACAVRVPVAIDESASESGALDHRACSAACVKIARCGGISGLLKDAARARAAGYELYLASTLDGPLGIAAALHAACAVSIDLPCGLATLREFERAEHQIPAVHARMLPPGGAGLGDTQLALYDRWAKRLS